VELTNEFSVSVPVSQAWALLTDLERIAPCMPGAELQEVVGDEHRGVVKVKVGPIVARYQGTAEFVERDETSHRAVLRAQGRDTRGQGNAAATVTATLAPEGEGTHVSVRTDLTISGKVAQFGRGVLADVSAKLLRQFVESLEANVLSVPPPPDPDAVADEDAEGVEGAGGDGAGPVAERPGTRPGRTTPTTGATRLGPQPVEPVDLLATAGSSLLKRLVPLVVVAVVLLWLLRRRR
jgi:uncharacterized protein